MSKFTSALNRRVILPLYYRKSGDRRLQRLDELEYSQWLSRADLEKQQSARLASLVKHAYETTDYYRKTMDRAGVSPDDINTAEKLTLLPTVSKAELQAHAESMKSQAYDSADLIADSSGGSTGVPTNFYKDLERHRLRRADQIRHDQWCGWKLGEPYALLWGAQKDLSMVQSFRERIISRYVDRAELFDAFEMRAEDIPAIVAGMRRHAPTMLIGYAKALALFCRLLEETGTDFPLKLEGVISSAESLTEDDRKLVEKTLRCKVLNRYGSREVGLVASECDRQEGLHVNFENVIVEVLDGDQPVAPGESGELVVTDLRNLGMPMIRYRMGDVGAYQEEACSCGRALPMLAKVEGRVSDFFIAADGTRVHGEYFTHLFYGVPQVKRFQFVQESLELVTIRLVSDEPELDAYVRPAIDKTREILGGNVDVKIERCEAIPPTASGKFMFTISRVSA